MNAIVCAVSFSIEVSWLLARILVSPLLKYRSKMVQVVNTSTDLNWLITRNTSSFLLKRRGVGHFFSTDPLNPKGLYKPRFQGTVQKRALTVKENPSGKGIVLVYKNKRNQNKPAKAVTRVALNPGASRALKNIKQFVNKQQYRSDLKNVRFYLVTFWQL